jgi:hypothetical protein
MNYSSRQLSPNRHIWYKTILLVILVAVNTKHFHPERVANNFFFLATIFFNSKLCRKTKLTQSYKKE